MTDVDRASFVAPCKMVSQLQSTLCLKVKLFTMEANVLGCVTFRIEGVSITVFMLEEAEMRNISADDVSLI